MRKPRLARAGVISLKEDPRLRGDDTVGLRLLVAFQRFHAQALHKVVVLRDFGFGEVQVHLHALVEQFWRLGGFAEELLAHHAVGALVYRRGRFPPGSHFAALHPL